MLETKPISGKLPPPSPSTLYKYLKAYADLETQLLCKVTACYHKQLCSGHGDDHYLSGLTAVFDQFNSNLDLFVILELQTCDLVKPITFSLTGFINKYILFFYYLTLLGMSISIPITQCQMRILHLGSFPNARSVTGNMEFKYYSYPTNPNI